MKIRLLHYCVHCLESWDNLVTSISFSSTNVLDYDSIVGALLVEEMRRKSSQEASTSEVMLVRG
jgi:hypothetical protein